LVAAVYLSPFLAVLIAFFFVKRLAACPEQGRLGVKTGSSGWNEMSHRHE